MSIETRNLVAGKWVDGSDHVENVNPSDLSDVIGHHAQAEASQLDEALDAARIAQRQWWEAGIQKRHDVLMAIGNALMAQAQEIGALLSREEGKPMAVARSIAPGNSSPISLPRLCAKSGILRKACGPASKLTSGASPSG